jgi:AcrR family transcriptional regulator
MQKCRTLMSENEQRRLKTSPAGTDAAAVVDRRVRRTRRQILDATGRLLATRGIDGVTMDAVADGADVSRSTLYRHWPHLPDLLSDALHHLGDQVVDESSDRIDADSFEQCIMEKAQMIGRRLRDDEWRTLIAMLAAAAETNPEAATAYDRWVAVARHGVSDYVRECRAADGLDPEWVSDLVLGPIYMNALVLHQPMGDEQIARHVTRTLALVGGRR